VTSCRWRCPTAATISGTRRELLATEQALLATVAQRRHEGVAVVSSEAVTGALGAHPTLTGEQVALVWELTMQPPPPADTHVAVNRT
jgi:hypothetical protein